MKQTNYTWFYSNTCTAFTLRLYIDSDRSALAYPRVAWARKWESGFRVWAEYRALDWVPLSLFFLLWGLGYRNILEMQLLVFFAWSWLSGSIALYLHYYYYYYYYCNWINKHVLFFFYKQSNEYAIKVLKVKEGEIQV
jgi:hypothetical protein